MELKKSAEKSRTEQTCQLPSPGLWKQALPATKDYIWWGWRAVWVEGNPRKRGVAWGEVLRGAASPLLRRPLPPAPVVRLHCAGQARGRGSRVRGMRGFLCHSEHWPGVLHQGWTRLDQEGLEWTRQG